MGVGIVMLNVYMLRYVLDRIKRNTFEYACAVFVCVYVVFGLQILFVNMRMQNVYYCGYGLLSPRGIV